MPAGGIPTPRLPFRPMRALLSHFKPFHSLPSSPRRLFSLHPHLVSQRSTPLLSPRRSIAMAVDSLKPQSPIATFSAHKLESDAEFWKYVEPSGSTPGHYVYDKPIHKSEQDDREYRAVRLQNGLQAVLVHDAKTDKAAASLDVAVGHLSDPDDIPGLAHFCEHLLFMGTEQFPKENEYSEYLSKNGGNSNAYTAASNTNYYFSVSSTALYGALERFSGFFHSPLFHPSCTLRELNAVDSENKKNLQNDMWRIFQLNKHLTKPGHVWSKFGTGNKQTLTEAARKARTANKFTNGNGNTNGTLIVDGSPANGKLSPNGSAVPSPIPSRVASPAPSVASSVNSESDADGGAIGRETRRRLIEWWKKEYSADRMSLCIIGKESLDDLTTMAATLFSPIANRGVNPAPYIPDHPFGPDERSTIVHVKTIMDFYAFEISFPLPYQPPHWRVKPDNFLAHFVGHEGPGSLHAYLKNKGWITSLSAGPQNLGRGFAMFKATIHLTKEGFQNYREAVLACYKYLNLLRDAAFPPRYQEEIKTLSRLRFRFAEKRRPDSYATWVAEHLSHPVPRALVLSGPQLTWDWDENLVREMLSNLNVESGRVVIMAKDHTTIGKGPDTVWQKEPWYGTDYIVEKMDATFMEAAKQPNDIPELFLPSPNEFIPTNVEVEKKDTSQPLKRPILVKQSHLTELWHKKDDQFWVPKAQVMIEARTPVANASPKASVMTRLFADLVQDSLTEFAYDADLAGLRYNLGASVLGIYMSLSGYNDKLHVLAQHVLEKIKNLDIKKDRLEVMKEQLKLNWENFFLGQTYHLSDYFGKYILSDQQFILTEKLPEISGITVEDMLVHKEKMLAELKYILLVNGNLKKEDAHNIASMTEHILGAQALPEDSVPRELSRLLPEGCNHIWELKVPNPNEPNSAVLYYCHVGNISNPRLRTTFRLLAQILHEPAFNVLRTKEQLGYIVFSSEWQGTESIGLRFLVQSEKDTKYVESRIDAFLDHVRGVIETMDEAHFQEQKDGLTRKWNEKLKNMNEETNRFWNHIDSGYLDFSRRERDAILLQTVTKDEVLAMFAKYIDPASSTRSKFSVHLRSQKPTVRKFSLPAAQAFLVLLRTHNIPVDEEKYLTLSAGEPAIAAVKAHWTDVLVNGKDPEVRVDPAVAKTLLEELDVLGTKYPAVGEGVVELSPAVVYIQDGKEFRQGLKLSGPAKAVEEFYDLPLSKY